MERRTLAKPATKKGADHSRAQMAAASLIWVSLDGGGKRGDGVFGKGLRTASRVDDESWRLGGEQNNAGTLDGSPVTARKARGFARARPA
ncbi:hypothetical protein L484_006017 [Morus notabilis]|uniref:Uncharacterized protein n=1 Tax=Morus notabilis TaxID=981085 RepID=W9QLI9_9ROSA|nr:hypothetical protein L484_006017 [Morus notabilis]